MKSEKLVSDIGFKTKVTLKDVFELLKVWRCNAPFMARYCCFSLFYFLFFYLIRKNMLIKKKKNQYRRGQGAILFYHVGFLFWFESDIALC